MKSIELVCINYGSFSDALKVTHHCIKQFPRIEKATIIHPEASVSTILPIDSEENLSKIYAVQAMQPTQHLCTLKEMPRHLTRDYCISIQWDGFIIRPDFWDERFLDYDYIAPPWPLQNILNPAHRVGSGGFCMFSRRLAEYWVNHGDPLIPNDWERGAVNRKKYEDAGFTFAPIDVALRFGKELDLDDYPMPDGLSFGFHGFQYNDRERYRSMVYGSFADGFKTLVNSFTANDVSFPSQ